jgi:hemolysin III
MQDAASRVTVGPFQNPVRGALHGAGAALWLLLGAEIAAGPGFPERAALLLCTASQAALFATSALYHSLPWRPRWKARMQRADHAMIHVKIAGTVTALTWLAGPPPWSAAVAGAAWASAVAAGAHKLRVARIPEHPGVRLQLAQALLGLPALALLAQRSAGTPRALLLGGGLLYLAGALCFAARRPVLWPRVFSFHEVFHALVLLGSVAHLAFVSGFRAPPP